jgi:tRNA uridine 5-carboxymethylaminomethyl modification enzyme
MGSWRIKLFDVVVIGGGHAGIEASWVSANQELSVCLITLDLNRIGAMSCNPAIGGQGKGQLVKELDVLGGLMPRIADETGIQFRKLNTKKGPAVWSSRSQTDKEKYSQEITSEITGHPNIEIVSGEVCNVEWLSSGKYKITLKTGQVLNSRSTILTVGTFLNGLMHVGTQKMEGGRHGDSAAKQLSKSMQDNFGIRWKRFKTGTPPRLERDSIKWSLLKEQRGDEPPCPFSLWSAGIENKINCYLTYTNQPIHQLIEENIDLAPLYNGQITSQGPRYCPSIEDKVMRFKGRERHQIFLEPESLETSVIYVNGLSTSLPADVQEAVVHKINGLENAQFLRHGYAVEYDCIDPRILDVGLQHLKYPGLFFAGQINGTSGYEEAAVQGLVAGLSAACFVKSLPTPKFDRAQSYIGVLLDDLVHKGSEEPYRMFTSRCEYRMSIREDNAIERLLPLSEQYKLLPTEKLKFCRSIIESKSKLMKGIESVFLETSKGKTNLVKAIRRNEFSMDEMFHVEQHEHFRAIVNEVGHRGYLKENLFIELKYEGYLAKERKTIVWMNKEGKRQIPAQTSFHNIPGLSNEARDRLTLAQPHTLSDVRKLFGVTPADELALLRYLEKRRGSEKPQNSNFS